MNNVEKHKNLSIISFHFRTPKKKSANCGTPRIEDCSKSQTLSTPDDIHFKFSHQQNEAQKLKWLPWKLEENKGNPLERERE